MKRKAAYGYTRNSTDHLTDGESLASQHAAIEKYAADNDIVLLGIGMDEALSGRSLDNRPAARRVIAEACRKRVPIIVTSLSRLFRNLRDAVDTAERLADRGSFVISLTESSLDLSTLHGRTCFRFMALFGELEREQTVMRTKAVMEHLRCSGRRCSGRIPYGADLGSDGSSLVVNPRESAVIARMQALRRNGATYAEIGRLLEQDGIPSKCGRARWRPRTVKAVVVRGVPKTASAA